MRSKFKWIFTLLVALSMQFSFAQEKTVTGVVSDATGPLPGANVVVKGTTRGVSTDVDGKYAIKTKVGETLVFSFVGMPDQSKLVGASNTISVVLVANATSLDEVVVTSLGIAKKPGAITSSNQVVKAQELNQAANPNAVQALIGKVSGLQINTTNSGVNPTTRIVIRNNKSITGTNTALIVIDGVISTSTAFSSLDPGSIESVNTMKGAQGSALYGSDGASGVIIVTTRKGSGNEKMKVSVTSSLDFETLAFLPTRQTRYGQGWNGQNVSYENGAWGAEFDGTMVAVGLPQADGSYIMAPYSSRGSDNIKDFFKTGVFSQNRISLSSGSNDGYISLTAEKQARDFVVDGDQYDKKSFLFKAGKKVGKISFDGNVGYTNIETTAAGSLLYDDLLQTATNIPIKEFANSGNAGHWSVYTNNPYWVLKNIRDDNTTDIFNGIARLQYDINKNINVSYNANINITNRSGLSFTNAYNNAYEGTALYDNSVASTFSTFNNTRKAIYADLLFNFDYDLTDNLNLKANLGNNVQDIMNTQVGVGGNNLAIEGLYNIGFLTGLPTFNGNNTFNFTNRLRKYSYFGQVDLAYKNFLFLNLTGRNDWTSNLNANNNNYFYPSAGLSFVPTDAFEGLKSDTFNYAKAYVNYTKVGRTSDINPYDINSLYASTAGYPFNGVGSYLQVTANTDPNIRPEFFTTREAGVNLGFFKNRLTIDAAAYITSNTDLITRISTSSASGVLGSRINVGESETKGFEIDLGFTPIDYRGFKWTNRLGYSTSKMMVLKVSDQSSSVAIDKGFATNAAYNVDIFAEEGEQFPLIKGIGYQRDEEGRVIVDANSGLPLLTNDFIKLGTANPDYILNYNTSFEYKGIRLAAVFDYRKGGEFYSETMYRLSTFGYLAESAQGGRTGFVFPNSSIEDPANPGSYIANTSVVTGGTTYSSYLNYNNTNFTEAAENFVLDATAFKVREIALSYSFSKELLDNTMLESLTIGVNARNPFIVLPKENRGYADPEASVTAGNGQGFQYRGQYPNTRSVGFSLNLTF
jgi:TonB-linked SusC/RagA family outer membrane protein